MSAASALVFAYHNVGCECLKVLLAHGVKVPLVLTHENNPSETIWFESVRALCRANRIEAITPDNPNTDDVVAVPPSAARSSACANRRLRLWWRLLSWRSSSCMG